MFLTNKLSLKQFQEFLMKLGTDTPRFDKSVTLGLLV